MHRIMSKQRISADEGFKRVHACRGTNNISADVSKNGQKLEELTSLQYLGGNRV